jgi:cytochrome c-type biogenesis protein CcmH/NrfG
MLAGGRPTAWERKNEMKTESNTGSDTIKKGNALIAVFCALTVGFLAGVAFGVYKTMPAGHAPTGHAGGMGTGPAADNRAAMAAALEKETADNPDNVDAWIQLGNIYFDRNQNDRAIGAYEKALALNPANADVWTDLGVMYRRKDLPKKAVAAFDKAIEVDQGHQTARFNKGVVLLHDLEDMPGAIAVWEDLVRINPMATTPSGQPVDELVRQMKASAAQKPAG